MAYICKKRGFCAVGGFGLVSSCFNISFVVFLFSNVVLNNTDRDRHVASGKNRKRGLLNTTCFTGWGLHLDHAADRYL